MLHLGTAVLLVSAWVPPSVPPSVIFFRRNHRVIYVHASSTFYPDFYWVLATWSVGSLLEVGDPGRH